MNREKLGALPWGWSLLCLGLAGVVSWQLLTPIEVSNPARRASSPPRVPEAATAPPLAAYEEIRARPLFSPDRRPAPARSARSAPEGGDPGAMKVVATALGPGYGRVLLRTADGGLIRAVAGDSIGGLRVTAVQKDGVVLSDSENRRSFIPLKPLPVEQRTSGVPNAAAARRQASPPPGGADSAATMAEVKRLFEGSPIGTND